MPTLEDAMPSEKPQRPTTPPSAAPTIDDVWNDDRGYLVALAARMLGDRVEAEDAVQDAFGRLALVNIDEIDDVRGWMVVVVRRLCLDRIRSAYSRREAATGSAPADDAPTRETVDLLGGVTDPADRVTLDEQVQLALSVVLDRLTPAERTSLVLHDVFGFPFEDVAEIVGRTPAACRQLASRARRSVRSGNPLAPPTARRGATNASEHRELSERFVAACAGGDLSALVALLDPAVDGEARLCGHGVFASLQGRPMVAQRVLGILGPSQQRTMVPFEIEGEPAVVAFDGSGRLAAVIRFDVEEGLIRHIHTFVTRS